ncbi:hypothetical protein RI030_01325 [Aphanizomenon flos-aquae NRERC-008]|nr:MULTISPECIES: hypothetical protein [Aphanizomenon]MDJ0505915.1 hypothetical protein [Nostocales cyanobacterium LE14-WE12]MDS9396276.1 hypothetical protein [Aphanizomenon flos-aquae NRERC-008]
MLKNFKALISATLSTHQAVFYRKVRSLLPDRKDGTQAPSF